MCWFVVCGLLCTSVVGCGLVCVSFRCVCVVCLFVVGVVGCVCVADYVGV